MDDVPGDRVTGAAPQLQLWPTVSAASLHWTTTSDTGGSRACVVSAL
jgi:hypothetical protein